MSNISAGDFGCCGSWHAGCAVDKGCIYGAMASTDQEATNMLLYAMQHCHTFKRLYLDKDAEFIKTWKESVANIGKPKRQVRMSTKETDTKVSNVIKEAEALLRSLGL
jgi:hypothetical protein